ncbi:MAG TPA: permease [Archaeoglobaceae archaeon]|nr:permease [Archaeoglobaceae archaeon]
MSSNLKASTVIIAAILMGSLAVFVRNVPLHPIQIVFFRTFFGFLFLSIPVMILREKFSIARPKTVVAIIIVNLLTISSYIASIQLIEVAIAALLLYMAPIYVLPIAYLTGERTGKTIWLALPIGISGLYLMLTPYGEFSPGIIFGLISGLCYAAMFFLMKSIREHMSSLNITFIFLGAISLIVFPSLLIYPLKDVNIFWLLGLGLIPTAIAFTLFYYGLKYCKISQAPVFALVEPVSAAIFGFIFFSETLGDKQILGSILILVSVALAWRKIS